MAVKVGRKHEEIEKDRRGIKNKLLRVNKRKNLAYIRKLDRFVLSSNDNVKEYLFEQGSSKNTDHLPKPKTSHFMKGFDEFCSSKKSQMLLSNENTVLFETKTKNSIFGRGISGISLF